ncbi:MAG: PadR family transcriptional regulator [Bacteroidota bacterium]
MAKLSKELIGATSIPIILSVLERQPSYGYEIIQAVKEVSEGYITYGDGTIYPVLHKMEKQELIESYWEVAENGRKRKYYKLCEKGKSQLASEQENWQIIHQIIAKLWRLDHPLTFS